MKFRITLFVVAFILFASFAHATIIRDQSVSITGGGITQLPTITVASSTSVRGASSANYVCDGTDDDVQIQAALDQFASTGGTVTLLGGTFYCSTQIDLYSEIILTGQGPSTVLYRVDSTAGNVLDLDDCSYVEISYLKVDGNRENQTRLESDNTGNNIAGDDVAFIQIHHTEQTAAVYHGIFFTHTVDAVRLTDNYCYENGYRAIHIHGRDTETCEHSIISSNLSRANGVDPDALGNSGIFVMFANNHYITVTDNIIWDEPGYGLEAAGFFADTSVPSKECVFGNNIVEGCQYGLAITNDVEFATFSNNYINDCTGAGVNIAGNASDITFMGGQITNNGDLGIVCQSSTYERFIIDGVLIADNAEGGAKFRNMDDSIISNCIFDDNDDGTPSYERNLWIYTCDNLKVVNCRVTDTDKAPTAPGLWIEGACNNVEIINTTVDVTGTGLIVDASAVNTSLINYTGDTLTNNSTTTSIVSYNQGSMGVGTLTPDEKFEVEWSANVDIELGVGASDTDVTFITLRSPNGTKRYLTINDSNAVSASTSKP